MSICLSFLFGVNGVGLVSAFTAMRRWRLSRDQFCIFSDNFRSAVYKTYTRGASKNAKYCYLEASCIRSILECGNMLMSVEFHCCEGDGIW